MWFREHKKGIAAILLTVLILFLTVLCKSGGALREAIQDQAAFVIGPVSKISRGIGSGFSGIFRFKTVVAENQRLEEENARLRQENARLSLDREEKAELAELETALNWTRKTGSSLQAADVIALDPSNWQGIFVIDKGTDSGIRSGCTVISGDGLVGRVVEPSRKTAKVASILADGSKISFRAEGENPLTGVLESDGKGGLQGYLLDGEEELRTGGLLMTSGIGVYAKGMKIGTVTKTEKKEGARQVIFEAEPVVDFFRLRKVAVIL